VRTTARNPTRRRRFVEVTTSEVATSEVTLPSWERDRVKPRKCVICGTQFPARGRWKTCTPECSKAHKLAQLREQGRRHYAANSEKIRERRRRRRPPKTKECVICGKNFGVTGKKASKVNACSPTCQHERTLMRLRAWRARKAHSKIKETSHERVSTDANPDQTSFGNDR
jgi:Zn ribbon nucleic-acid-binding protein